MTVKEQLEELKKTLDEQGVVLFHMAFSHLMDVGVRNITDEAVETTKAQLRTDEAAGKMKNSFMTANFQCNLLDYAAMLAKIPSSSLLLFAKLYLDLDGDDMLLAESAEKEVDGFARCYGESPFASVLKNPECRETVISMIVDSKMDAVKHAAMVSDADILGACNTFVKENPDWEQVKH